MAMKATYGIVDGQPKEIFKDPITDSGTKKSAKGLLQVTLEDNEYVLYDQASVVNEASNNELKTVFSNGKLVRETTLAQIRKRLWS